mmetsp:Transcript_40808/g.130265  ORF Transcript_40808/g.130265 Transcript_40808/m.130265 type:complete len:333 (-) Transcript_40808:141-1139(-)
MFTTAWQSENNVLADLSCQNPERSPDPGLTEIGLKQVEKVCERLASGVDGGIWRIYSSPMTRTLLTAAPLSKALGVPVRVRTDIFEQGGVFRGGREVASLTRAAESERGLGSVQMAELCEGAELLLPDEVREDGWWDRGYETLDKTIERARGVARWLWELAEEWAADPEAEGHVVLFTHGMFTDMLAKCLMLVELSENQMSFFCSSNASVTVFHLQTAGEAAGNSSKVRPPQPPPAHISARPFDCRHERPRRPRPTTLRGGACDRKGVLPTPPPLPPADGVPRAPLQAGGGRPVQSGAGLLTWNSCSHLDEGKREVRPPGPLPPPLPKLPRD